MTHSDFKVFQIQTQIFIIWISYELVLIKETDLANSDDEYLSLN